jgi:hypothetical protein
MHDGSDGADTVDHGYGCWCPKGIHHDQDFDATFVNEIGLGWPDFHPARRSDQVKSLVKNRCDSYELWGVKTNKIAHFIPDFVDGMEGNGLQIITTSRPISESIESIVQRSGCSIEHAEQMIYPILEAIGYHLRILDLHPSLVVDYHAAIDDPISFVERLASIAGVEVNQTAIDFIDKKLRRIRHDHK